MSGVEQAILFALSLWMLGWGVLLRRSPHHNTDLGWRIGSLWLICGSVLPIAISLTKTG